MSKSKKIFFICPIGKSESEERKRSDKLLKYILDPISQSLGFHTIRADMMPKSGVITTQILNMVIDAPLVIADLTNGNPNVFYELALRHAVNKPYLQLIDESQSIPFDVSGVRTISYNLSDLDAVEKTKSEVSKYISAILAGHIPDSPISIAIASESLGVPDNVLAVFLEKFWTIEEDLSSILKNVDGIEDVIDNKIDNAVSYIISELEDDA